MTDDDTSICMALIEAARAGVARARRRAKWNMFVSPLSGDGELGIIRWAFALFVLAAPGVALFTFVIEGPMWLGVVLSSATLTTAWGFYAQRAYNRLPPDKEMVEMVANELRGLNELLARRAAERPHALLEMRNVDALERELAAIEEELHRGSSMTYR